ncbi:MAG: hypothetical protein NTY45_06545 [Elusimicrobia bacterium]|nr:hypothetical protein [Elusimicrobiota bacterium]
MTLRKKVSDWKRSPNALGAEAQAAVIVGEVAAAFLEDIPENVRKALRKLSLRGVMRDLIMAIHHGEEYTPSSPECYEVAEIAAESAGLSWGEAIAEITKYLDEHAVRLPGKWD